LTDFAVLADFRQQLSEFDSRSGITRACVAWCGVGALTAESCCLFALLLLLLLLCLQTSASS
jgi:hypothetical protein